MMSLNLFQQTNYNGYVIHPTEQVLYLYDSRWEENIQYIDPVLDLKIWKKYWNQDKVASEQPNYTEGLLDAFYPRTVIPNTNGRTFADSANAVLSNWDQAVARKDKDYVGATITSQDYGVFQNIGVIATSDTIIPQGIIASLFPEIATPQLAGKYVAFDDDIVWYPNVPEGSSVEPSKGTGTVTDIVVGKGEGAVETTYRALTVINGAGNPFQRLTGKLQNARAAKENAIVTALLEAATAHTAAGVDFGSRSGTPPVSQQNPLSVWESINNYFAPLVRAGQPDWQYFIAKGAAYTDYINNDVVRGTGVPIGNSANTNGQINPIPGVPGKSWVSADELLTATAGYAVAPEAIAKFRGPTTFFNVASQLTETTRNVLRSYWASKVVKPELIFQVTGIYA